MKRRQVLRRGPCIAVPTSRHSPHPDALYCAIHPKGHPAQSHQTSKGSQLPFTRGSKEPRRSYDTRGVPPPSQTTAALVPKESRRDGSLGLDPSTACIDPAQRLYMSLTRKRVDIRQLILNLCGWSCGPKTLGAIHAGPKGPLRCVPGSKDPDWQP